MITGSIQPGPGDEPDELQFVDADIRAAFEGAAYTTGTPTIAQLSRNVRALTLAIKDMPSFQFDSEGHLFVRGRYPE